MSRKRFTADQWRVWFEEFDQGGLTVQQFCDAKGTTANTFYNWRRRLREEQSAQENLNRNAKRTSFVSVNLAAPTLGSSAAATPHVEIELGDGIVARVPNDQQSLRPILEVLLERKDRS